MLQRAVEEERLESARRGHSRALKTWRRAIALSLFVSLQAQADAGITIVSSGLIDPTLQPSIQNTVSGDSCFSAGAWWSAALSYVELAVFLRVTRVDEDGGVLDPIGIPVTTAIADIWGPKIACAPLSMMVVWLDETGTVRGQMFDGAANRGPAVNLGQNTTTAVAPQVGWSGSEFIVSWLDASGRIRASRVTAAGTILDPGGVSLVTGAQEFALASNGNALAWTLATDGGLRFAHVTPSPPSIGASQITATTRASSELSIETNATGRVLLAWSQVRQGANREPWALLEDAGAPVRVGTGTGDEWSPRALFESTAASVIFGDGNSVLQSGLPRDGGVQTLSTRQLNMRPLSARHNGSQTLVLSMNNQELNFGWLSRGPLGPLDQEGFARAPGHQLGHDLTGDGTSASVWWHQKGLIQNASELVRMTRFTSPTANNPVIDVLTDCCTTMLRATRVDGSDSDIAIQRKLRPGGYDGEPLVLSAVNALQQYTAPPGRTGEGTEVGISRKGTTALAFWRNSQSLVAWRVSVTANDLSSAVTIPVSIEATSPAAHPMGNGWWVVWKEGFGIRASYVQDTATLTAGPRVTLTGMATTPPSIAGDEAEALVLFGINNTVGGVLLGPTGVIGAPFDAIMAGSAVSAVHHQPVSGGYLVAYAQTTADPLEAALLSRDGALLAPPLSVTSPGLVVRDPRVTAVPQPMIAWREVNPVSHTWQVRVATTSLRFPGVDAGQPDSGVSDAGPGDAGAADAGTGDAGAPDAGSPDSGATDSGAADAGGVDAGGADAGALDSGTADAGPIDSGAVDGGTSDDGGQLTPPDAGDGGAVDAGQSDGGLNTAPLNVGCGCTGVDPGAWFVGLAITLFSRRRRTLRAATPPN